MALTHKLVFYSLSAASSSDTSPTAPHPENLPFNHTRILQALTLPSASGHTLAFSITHPAWAYDEWIHTLLLRPRFPWPVSFRHSNPQLEITPTAATSSSASALGLENFAQGRCKTTENSPVKLINLRIHASKQPWQDPGAAGNPLSHSLLLLFLETPQRWSWIFSLLSFSVSIPMAPLASVPPLLEDYSHPV